MPLSPELFAQAAAEAKRQAAENSYSPYSGFRVGAAVVTAAGAIHGGCNVENASYGLTCCAERTAIFRAIAMGEAPLKIEAVVVYTPAATPSSPCGACRQVIFEFGPTAEVRSLCAGGGELHSTMAALFPQAFGREDVLPTET